MATPICECVQAFQRVSMEEGHERRRCDFLNGKLQLKLLLLNNVDI